MLVVQFVGIIGETAAAKQLQFSERFANAANGYVDPLWATTFTVEQRNNVGFAVTENNTTSVVWIQHVVGSGAIVARLIQVNVVAELEWQVLLHVPLTETHSHEACGNYKHVKVGLSHRISVLA